MAKPSLIQHVVIIVKENHSFDNYFGHFPHANGDATLAHASDPPTVSPAHDHATWLKRATAGVRQQYWEADIPSYFAYARQYRLCDNYFTDVGGPSTPNHLMLVAAASPIVNNSHFRDPVNLKPPFDLPALPENLQAAGLTWRNYGGYVFDDILKLRKNPWTVHSPQFALDAAAGTLPSVSWVYAPRRVKRASGRFRLRGHGLDSGPSGPGRRDCERGPLAQRRDLYHLGRLGRMGRSRYAAKRGVMD